MSKTHGKHRVGILGGGQLARMLALAAHNMGLQPWVLSQNPEDPAAQVTKWWVKGNPNSPTHLGAFLKNVDVVTVESEFLDAEVLKKVCRKSKVPIFPRAEHLLTLQDRLFQKLMLRKSNLPTLPFVDVHHSSQIDFAIELFGFPLVIKKRHFGYDGYGTFVLKSHVDKISFLNSINLSTSPCIAEPWFEFSREIAISTFRNKKRQMQIFPLVETFQKNSICNWVKGPTKSRFLPKIVGSIKRFLKNTDYVGTLTFELFETSTELLINEVAPRVHNSAHYSIDALSTSQFEYHLKAVMGLELPNYKLIRPAFAMVNLLGGTKKVSPISRSPDTFLHWYGKSENRIGRKMGHVNSMGNTPAEALKLAQLFLRNFK